MVLTLLAVLAGSTVYAKGPKNMNCANLLAAAVPAAASEFTYEVSDFEGLFLDILTDTALAHQIPAAKQAYAAEEFLKKKASFLNQAIYIVRQMRSHQARGIRSPLTAEQVFNMIISLGVDPSMYGVEINEEKQEIVVLPFEEGPKNVVADEQKVDPRAEYIGFIATKNASERDLPDHLKRAVGFGRSAISREAGPQRRTGGLEFQIGSNNEVIVIDLSKKLKYTVESARLSAGAVQTDEKLMKLAFSQSRNSWFVAFKNLANPEGHIGFGQPAKEAQGPEKPMAMGFAIPKK
ncbi:MAG: hypothetical protein AABZ31_07640 [Bdellovibrionota bacterium]